ncbi:hypothetical protein MUO71_06100 [Candidatus Bathyarchaeota archaeon]|nr:hypothetical protein [Candidatus Bathyarchaeota archaeon]
MNVFLWPIIMVLIAALAVIFFIRLWKSGYPRKDERTERITGKAGFYSMHIGLYFMIALLFVRVVDEEFFGSSDLDVNPVLYASILIPSVSFIVLRWYFNRKGDF